MSASTVEVGEAEVFATGCRPPRDTQIHSQIMDFLRAIGKSFNHKPLGVALIAAVQEAAQISLSAIMVAGSLILADRHIGFLAETLALLRRRKTWKVRDPVP